MKSLISEMRQKSRGRHGNCGVESLLAIVVLAVIWIPIALFLTRPIFAGFSNWWIFNSWMNKEWIMAVSAIVGLSGAWFVILIGVILIHMIIHGLQAIGLVKRPVYDDLPIDDSPHDGELPSEDVKK